MSLIEPRQIDGIPETVLLKLYLGSYASLFEERFGLVFSPSFGPVHSLHFYHPKPFGYIPYELKVYLRVTERCLVLTSTWELPAWVDIKISLTDPEGPQKVQDAFIKWRDALPRKKAKTHAAD